MGERVEAERRRDHREVGVAGEPAADESGARDAARQEVREQPRQLARGRAREPRRIAGAADVPDAVVQRAALESQRRRRARHRLEAEPPQQDVGGEVVAGGADQRGDVGGRQRGDAEVLPDAGVGDRVLVRAREQLRRVEVALLDRARRLDEQQQLAEAGGRQRPVGVAGREHLAARRVTYARAPLHAVREVVQHGPHGTPGGVRPLSSPE